MAKGGSSKEVIPGNYDPEIAGIRLPMMAKVPEGKFLMGTSEDDIKHLQLKESDWAYDWSDNEFFEGEKPQHTVTLPAFEIGQFPVTNAEYHVFTTLTGHRLPRGWVGFRFLDEMDLHPVVGVSKVDAEAYIKWFNERSGLNFRLPTEAEWERAARGDDGRIYPWGNTFDPWRCNTSESMKKGTTAVGFYTPSGNSPFGVADMVGNVWEWTGSMLVPYGTPEGAEPDDKKNKIRFVIRGGAWYYTRKLARCAAREGMTADQVSPIIGFRLARDMIF